MIIEWVHQGRRLDAVLTADTGADMPQSYEYLPIFQKWMNDRGIENHIVRYQPKNFKHWPPYFTILENCLTNSTLPSASFGRKSCSVKWKIQPQDLWVSKWQIAKDIRHDGGKVVKLIGYDASPADSRRYANRLGVEDPRYDYLYPLLQEWAWDRSACVERIRAEGLPVPVKSSCVICAYLRPEELMALPLWVLRLIVLVEARAAPRLRNVEGLWRRGTKARPGSMTAFIRQRLLLDPAEIDAIIAGTPVDLIDFQRVAAAIPVDRRPHMREWIDRFNEGVEKLAA